MIVPPQGEPIAIDASGAAGTLADLNFYHGQKTIPHRGPKAALTVAGTVSGWSEALAVSSELGGVQKPLARLLGDAIRYAADGIPVTHSQAEATQNKLRELVDQPGFARTFLLNGAPLLPVAGLLSRTSPIHYASSPKKVWIVSIAVHWRISWLSACRSWKCR